MKRNIEIVASLRRKILNGQKENSNMDDSIKRIPWVTEFYNILKIENLERKLVPGASITYCRPPTLGNSLLNYRRIAHNHKKDENHQNKTKKCGQCGLCGNYGGLPNMVVDDNTIKTKDNKTIIIKQQINCKDFGIYAGQCQNCGEFYVGQTKNQFNKRWNSHRTSWAKAWELKKKGQEVCDDNDEQALFVHFYKNHSPRKNIKISEAYKVWFLEKPSYHRLDAAESFWITKLKASINIRKTFLPKIK